MLRFHRGLITSSLLVLGIVFTCTILLADEETLAELIAKAQQAGGHQAELYAKIAQREVEVANEHFTKGEVSQAHEAVRQAVSFAGKALESARHNRKRLKQTDIRLRKASRRLSDIAGTLAFEDRPAVNDAAKQIEEVRTQVLELMFGPTRKTDKSASVTDDQKKLR